MGRFGIGLLLAVVLLCFSCGGGEKEGQGGGIDSGGHGGSGQGGTGGMVAVIPCTDCMAGQGCIFVTVTRSSDVSNQPWTVWPDEADGRGTLIVAAYDGTRAFNARRAILSADMTPASAHYEANLGCVPVGTQSIGVFLDDNEDAPASSIMSSDYHDSCPMNRSLSVSVAAMVTARIDVVLANSCD